MGGLRRKVRELQGANASLKRENKKFWKMKESACQMMESALQANYGMQREMMAMRGRVSFEEYKAIVDECVELRKKLRRKGKR